jgi:exocyst complex component 8
MESLRSKASARKGPKPVAKLSKPEKNNARTSRVDDKIKRRMSARYATISSPTPADVSAPSVPTISLGLREPGLGVVREQDEVVQKPAPSKEDIRAAENKLLDVDDFNPDACSRSSLFASSHT